MSPLKVPPANVKVNVVLPRVSWVSGVRAAASVTALPLLITNPPPRLCVNSEEVPDVTVTAPPLKLKLVTPGTGQLMVARLPVIETSTVVVKAPLIVPFEKAPLLKLMLFANAVVGKPSAKSAKSIPGLITSSSIYLSDMIPNKAQTGGTFFAYGSQPTAGIVKGAQWKKRNNVTAPVTCQHLLEDWLAATDSNPDMRFQRSLSWGLCLKMNVISTYVGEEVVGYLLYRPHRIADLAYIQDDTHE